MVKRYIGRIVVGWVLIVLGSLWCLEARVVNEPAEGAAVGSFMFIGGVAAVWSGVRRRRRRREMLELAADLREGGIYPTQGVEEGRAARRAARDRELWGRG